MQKQDLDPGFSQPSHCSVPGCFSMPIFAGLCNIHCTKGQTEAAASQAIKDNQSKMPFLTGQGKGTIPAGTVASSAPIGHDRRATDPRMSEKYPQYYKPVPDGVKDIDIYMVCRMFRVEDTSGALHHALKKILLPGVRTGGKSRRDDIKEARDTLTRWLEVNS